GEVRWLPVLEFSPGDPRTWEIFPGLFGAPYLVVGTGAVFPASLVARVRQEAGNNETLVVVREGPSSASGIGRSTFFTEQFLSGEASPPPIPPPGAPIALPNAMGHGRVREGGQGVVMTLETPATPILDVDLAVIPEGFTASGWATPQDGPFPMHAAVGILASVAFGVGGYAAGIIGALLFQLSAILDCCDGEVARLKFMESAFGEQFDVVLDNVVHLALYAGIAWASFEHNWGPMALLLGGFAMLGNVAAFVVVQRATRMRK